MINLPANIRIYAYAGPCDMRKQMDGLAGLVRQGMQRDPLSAPTLFHRLLPTFDNRRVLSISHSGQPGGRFLEGKAVRESVALDAAALRFAPQRDT